MHDLSSPDVTGRAERTARQVRVHGRVQGVFFRRSLQERAEELGARGWVANRDDGTVEAWIEGSPTQVHGCLRWIEAGGPSDARVERVTVDEVAPVGHDGFAVR